MSTILRVMLLVASLVTAVWILRKIRKNRVKQEDALFWLCFAFMLALFGIFPKLSYMMAEILGIQSPANFVFLAVIAILIVDTGIFPRKQTGNHGGGTGASV